MSKQIKLILVAGARPNFMKIAPLIRAIQAHNEEVAHDEKVNYRLVHTGQHYDIKMSEIFFTELGIPDPDVNLEVGSGSHAEQSARVMMAFEPVCLEERPDWVVVVACCFISMLPTSWASLLRRASLSKEIISEDQPSRGRQDLNHTIIDNFIEIAKDRKDKKSKIRSSVFKGDILWEGKLLLIVLNEENIQADPERIRGPIGSLKIDIDSVQWQRRIRSEWDSRP
jgi:hypothetical protein